MTAAPEQPVAVEVNHGVARLTLNRPAAINSISHPMVMIMADCLERWRHDASVRTVVIDGAGERGLCAGADVRAIYHDGLAGGAGARRFFADEYRLNAAIARFPKPVVAFMDGIVLGGGVGVGGHASHRVVSEATTMGMPEVAIGFTPDVGGTYLLARAPGEIGIHLALTAGRMTAGDAMYCGFADTFIPRDRRGDVMHALESSDPDGALARFAEPAPAGPLAAQRSWIDRCYAAADVAEILRGLRDDGHPEASAAADLIETMSPTALEVTLRAVRAARQDRLLEQSLVREYAVSAWSLTGHDMLEGIRAQVVDKDRRPRWRPDTLAGVDPADVDRHFTPYQGRPLEIDVPGRPE